MVEPDCPVAVGSIPGVGRPLAVVLGLAVLASLLAPASAGAAGGEIAVARAGGIDLLDDTGRAIRTIVPPVVASYAAAPRPRLVARRPAARVRAGRLALGRERRRRRAPAGAARRQPAGVVAGRPAARRRARRGGRSRAVRAAPLARGTGRLRPPARPAPALRARAELVPDGRPARLHGVRGRIGRPAGADVRRDRAIGRNPASAG